MAPLPGSVLFACNRNIIRSPVAEGLMKRLCGHRVFVQSAGVWTGGEADPFMVAAAAEIGIDLAGHRGRSFEELEEAGEDIGGYDLIVALSPAAQRRALEYSGRFALEVEYWPTLDPAGLGETREQRLAAYRETRDQIVARLRARFAAG